MDILNTKIKSILTEKNTKIKPENIKKDVNILGITGTYEGESSGDYNAKFKAVTSTDRQVQKLLTELAPLDISNVTNMNYIFYSCSSLVAIPEMNTNHITTCQGLCNNCTSLINVPILNFSGLTGTGNNDMFANCSSLSNESLNNILATCITMTNVTNKTLKYIGLSSTQATTCQSLSNWSDFVTAGWTSGY
jgi:hypothetical protein